MVEFTSETVWDWAFLCWEIFKVFVYLFIGCAGALSLHRLSLVAASGGCSLVVVHELLSEEASPVVENGLCDP